MKSIGAIAFGVAVAVTAVTANAQDPNTTLSTTTRATQAPYYYSGDVNQSGSRSSAPLFTIGGFGVHVWTPMEQPYNTDADRNLAADPSWWRAG